MGKPRLVIERIESLRGSNLDVSMFALRTFCYALGLLGEYSKAVGCLDNILARCPNDFLVHLQLIDFVFKMEDGNRAINDLRNALNRFGKHPELLVYASRAKLHQREPGVACKIKLVEKTQRSVSLVSRSEHDGNLLNAYDHLGRAEWLQFINKRVASDVLSNIDLYANLMMQLSSIASPLYQKFCIKFLSCLRTHEPFSRHLSVEPRPLNPVELPLDTSQGLKVLWITGDVANHPVYRFLLGFFVASKNQRKHDHTIISLRPPSADHVSYLKDLADVSVIDASSYTAEAKTQCLRSFKSHVAIDLSGWTAGNHVTAWMARIAPVQVNYLGFHASTGIEQIDYWLGDDLLFSPDTTEWHTESLYRLSRPFLAWHPPSILPEGDVPVSESSTDPYIRFGCFNHFRKISDQCLQTWSSLLNQIPNSRLILKGATNTDKAAKDLTYKRLDQFGIDIKNVEWLPLTPTPREHLLQYSAMDIALDTFPNSGCTTTCEALWMGVPVIALRGSRYVESMSAAVLSGADCSDLICDTAEMYVQKALELSRKMSWLRTNRRYWREKIQASSLYEAADLFDHLENAFSDMAASVRHS